MIISGIGALDALISIRSNFKNGCGVNDSRNAVNVLKLVASGTLFTAAYTHSSEFIAFSAASTTLSYLSGGMALVALTKLISDIQRFQAAGQAYDEMDDYSKGNRNFYGAIYKKARSDLMLSIMNTIGWTSLFLSHIPALAAAAPVLMVMGAVFLIAGGTYASYTACRNMEADISVVDTTKSQGRTGLFALPYRQHHLDQQLDIIMTQKRRL